MFNPGTDLTDLTELNACQSASALVVHLGFADAIVPIVMSGTPPPTRSAQERNALTIECAAGVRVLLEDALARLERVLSGRAF